MDALRVPAAHVGSLAGALLVGNHGSGIIDVFDPGGNNVLLAELADPAERLLSIGGLWALRVGNGTNGGEANSVLFTAGINGGRDGVFGSLTPVLREHPRETSTFVAASVPWPASLAVFSAALVALGLGGLLAPARRHGNANDLPEARVVAQSAVCRECARI